MKLSERIIPMLTRCVLAVALGLATTVIVAFVLAAFDQNAVMLPVHRSVQGYEFSCTETIGLDDWNGSQDFSDPADPRNNMPRLIRGVQTSTPQSFQEWLAFYRPPSHFDFEPSGDSPFSLDISLSGWPNRCFYGWKEGVVDDPEKTHGLAPAPDWVNDIRYIVKPLPYYPLWRGLIANTFIFAVGWFALLFLPGIARRWRRRRRGACVACGYSRAGLTRETPCPECGKPT